MFTKENRADLNRTGVYKIICYKTNKAYYGSSASKAGMYSRITGHFKLLQKKKHHSWVLQRDWNKFGSENFEFIILEFCDPEQCKQKEQIYLDSYGAGDSNRSYNISPTAANNYGTKHTEATRKKYSESSKGRIRSKETCKKISEANKGKKMSEEAKLKMSLAKKGKKLSQEWINNREKSRRLSTKPKYVYTPEKRKSISEKISKSLKGRKAGTPSEKTKELLRESNLKVEYIITDPTGKIYEIKGLKRFCEIYNLRISNMVSVAQGNYTNHKGWTCYYKHNPKPLKQLKKTYIWKLISPTGEEFLLSSLLKFCKERNLDSSCFTRVASGTYKQYKGWKASKIELAS